MLDPSANQMKEEAVNFLRYEQLVMQLGAQKLLQVLQQHIRTNHQMALTEWLDDNREAVWNRLGGQNKWVRQKLYPASGTRELSSLDVTALKTIFTKVLTDFNAPQGGWWSDLQESDLSQGADILRLGKLRNGPHIAHNPYCEVSHADFETLWTEAEAILVRLDPDCHREIRALKFGQTPQ